MNSRMTEQSEWAAFRWRTSIESKSVLALPEYAVRQLYLIHKKYHSLLGTGAFDCDDASLCSHILEWSFLLLNIDQSPFQNICSLSFEWKERERFLFTSQQRFRREWSHQPIVIVFSSMLSNMRRSYVIIRDVIPLWLIQDGWIHELNLSNKSRDFSRRVSYGSFFFHFFNQRQLHIAQMETFEIRNPSFNINDQAFMIIHIG